VILEKLRQDTRDLHQALEDNLPLRSPELTREEYTRLVRGFYGFVAPIEEQLLKSGSWQETGIDFQSRLKTPLLEKDLAVLAPGTNLADIPRCTELPDVSTPQGALGYLYVIEGSTLGGTIISKHLAGLFSMDSESGAAYFSGYGKETREKWTTFLEALNGAAVRLNDDDAIVAAANATFGGLAKWL
jgi:heme oxygenase